MLGIRHQKGRKHSFVPPPAGSFLALRVPLFDVKHALANKDRRRGTWTALRLRGQLPLTLAKGGHRTHSGQKAFQQELQESQRTVTMTDN